MFKKFYKEYRDNFRKLCLSEKLFLGLVFSLPLERIPSFEVAGFTLKLSLFFGLALLLNLIRDIFNKKIALNLKNYFLGSKWLFLPLGILLYSLIGILWVENVSYWLKANVALGFSIAVFYASFLVFANLAEVKIRRERLLSLTLRTVMLSAGFILAFGFFQWFGDLAGLGSNITGIRNLYDADRLGLPRMHSTLLEPMWMGIYLLLPLSLLIADKKAMILKSQVWRLAMIGSILLAILLGLSRGAIAVSALVSLVGLKHNYYEIKDATFKNLSLSSFLKYGILSLSILLVIGLSISIFSKKGDDSNYGYNKGFGVLTGHLKKLNIFDKPAEGKRTSLGDRTIARGVGYDIATESKHNLLFGVGAGQFSSYSKTPEVFGGTSWVTLLDFMIDYGVLMLAFFILFLVMILKFCKSNRNSAEVDSKFGFIYFGLLLYFVGFWLQSFTTGSFTITHFWVVAGILYGLSLSADRNVDSKKS
jgi:hypothetical protein